MRYLTKLLISIILISLSHTSYSKKVSKSKAKIVAENFLTERISGFNNTILFDDDFINSKDSLTVYYVFNTNNGFVIVSADDAVYPVLGYSFDGNYSGDNFPPAFEAWMKNYEGQIVFAIKSQKKASEEIKQIWSKYNSGKVTHIEKSQSIEPLLYTKWSQGCYYNSLLPADTNGSCGHLYTGCVATAMGQVLKYYNYPKHGTGYHSYYTSYGVLEADFENTYYNWANMYYHLEEENPPVAELLYQCAVSVESQFYPQGTGANDIDARNALVQYFGYPDDIEFLWKDEYTGDWEEKLRNDLNNKRPVIYGAVAELKTLSGHTFVCDGYQDTTHFHFNWGWGGSYDGYFYLDDLTVGGFTFDLQHDAIFGIRPPGIIETQPPENISATVNSSTVSINWQAPDSSANMEIIGYNIFRNNSIVNPVIIQENNYTDQNVPNGQYEYTVKTVYIKTESDASESVQVQVASGVEDYLNAPVNIYPNPASGFLIINLKDNKLKLIEIMLFDLSGKQLLAKEITNNSDNEIKLKLPLISGTFLLQIKGENINYSQKVILVK